MGLMEDFNDAFFDLDTIAELGDYASESGVGAGSSTDGGLTSPPTDGVLSGVPVRMLFDADFLAAQGLGDMGVGTSSPAAWIKTADAPAVKRGDTLTRAGVDYTVVEARPDGHGLTLLILSRG